MVRKSYWWFCMNFYNLDLAHRGISDIWLFQISKYADAIQMNKRADNRIVSFPIMNHFARKLVNFGTRINFGVPSNYKDKRNIRFRMFMSTSWTRRNWNESTKMGRISPVFRQFVTIVCCKFIFYFLILFPHQKASNFHFEVSNFNRYYPGVASCAPLTEKTWKIHLFHHRFERKIG